MTVSSATRADFTTQVVDPGTNPYLQAGDQLSYTVYDGGEGSNGSGDSMVYNGLTRAGVFYAGGSQAGTADVALCVRGSQAEGFNDVFLKGAAASRVARSRSSPLQR